MRRNRVTPEMREAAVRLIESGMSKRRTCVALGIHRQTLLGILDPEYAERLSVEMKARKASYRGTCESCGRPTTGCNGPALAPRLCAVCIPASRVIWTPERIVRALQLYHERWGIVPTATAFSPGIARWRGYEILADTLQARLDAHPGEYPTTNTVQNTMGSWNAGLRAAGFETSRGGHRTHGQHFAVTATGRA